MDRRLLDSVPPAVLTRYTRLRPLGKGAMGLVFAAHDTTFGRDVALKIIDPVASSETAVERFIREARVLATVGDPHVARLLDAALAKPMPYIVMELLLGVSLEEVLRASRPQAGPEVAALLADLLSGLRSVHQAGVLHRDLKPSNVMMVDGRGAVLIDFGLARTLDESTVLTLAGNPVGTPRYLAPELVKGLEPTVSSDLFAVALIGFRAMVGTDLHVATCGRESVSLSEILSNLASGLYYDSASRMLRPHGPLGALLLRCLAVDPSLRPASAAEVLERLEAIRGSLAPRASTRPDAGEGTLSLVPVPVETRDRSHDAPPAQGTSGRRVVPILAVCLLAALAILRPGPPAAPPSGLAPSPRETPSLRAQRSVDLARALEAMRRWSGAPGVRQNLNRLRRRVLSARRDPEVASAVASMLATSGLELLGDPPVPLGVVPGRALDQELYWQLLYRHELESELAGSRPGRVDLSPCFPAHLRPGTAAPSRGTEFSTSLEPAGAMVVDAFSEELHGRGRDGMSAPVRWTLHLKGARSASCAWIALKLAEPALEYRLRLIVNRRLTVSPMPVDTRDRRILTHTIPAWCLEEGANTFELSAQCHHGFRLLEAGPRPVRFRLVL